MADTAARRDSVAIICGGGGFPGAVADAVARRGRRPVMFGLKGWADAEVMERYAHHWIAIGQVGRFLRLARAEDCTQVMFIGTVLRPQLSQIRIDWRTIRSMPRIIRSFRGGDDQLLSAVARVIEDNGLRVIGVNELASEILVPEGVLGRYRPSQRDKTDIARALALIAAIGPFDVGQAAVVADNHVLGIEAAEGTDNLLLRIAELRRQRRVTTPAGVGVLVKSPKPAQDRRFDLPSIGPQTVENAARAGLAGVAVAAGSTMMIDAATVTSVVDREKIFFVGVAEEIRTMTGAAPARPVSIYMVAAEESGDALGGALARALSARCGDNLKLSGTGGGAMASAGMTSPFAIDELSIIGLTAIPGRLPIIVRRIRDTADAVVAARPDALVIIDSPDFTHRVARRVRRLAPSIPILDYVSPSVWAWRPGRARAMRSYIDCVLAILPFEPAVHLRLGGPPCVYVGHPLVEKAVELRPNADETKRRLADPPVVLALPGSRRSEVGRLLGIFGAAIERVAARVGSVELVLPTMPHLLAQIREGVAGWALTPRVVVEPAEKFAAFRTARAALAASGTVTLELALAGVPTVAAYRLPLIEEIVLRVLSRSDRPHSVILANLVLGENVVPELLQRECTPAHLADALEPLLTDSPQRRRQAEAFGRLDAIMSIGSQTPSEKAAAVVLEIAERGRLKAPTAPA